MLSTISKSLTKLLCMLILKQFHREGQSVISLGPECFHPNKKHANHFWLIYFTSFPFQLQAFHVKMQTILIKGSTDWRMAPFHGRTYNSMQLMSPQEFTSGHCSGLCERLQEALRIQGGKCFRGKGEGRSMSGWQRRNHVCKWENAYYKHICY